MLFSVLKSKLHMATVTGAILEYEGSIGIDRSLMAAARILPYERVLISNMRNGARFETYVIPARAGSGEISLNGPAARLGRKGDRLVILAFAQATAKEAKANRPVKIVLGKGNKPAGQKR